MFLKSGKCYTAKCPLTRKPYIPGIFGKTRGKHSKRGVSEYGSQLREKQKIRFTYGLREKQFSNYVKEAKKKSEIDVSAALFNILESRLDNVVFRLGLAESRSRARQIVSHGHIMVNTRKVNIPSYRVKLGDKIYIRPQSLSKGIFKDLEIRLKKYDSSSWLKLDKDLTSGNVAGKPAIGDEMGMEDSLNVIMEFYSR